MSLRGAPEELGLLVLTVLEFIFGLPKVFTRVRLEEGGITDDASDGALKGPTNAFDFNGPLQGTCYKNQTHPYANDRGMGLVDGPALLRGDGGDVSSGLSAPRVGGTAPRMNSS